MPSRKFIHAAVLGLSLTAGLGAVAHAATYGAPGILSRSTDIGPIDRSSPIELTVWLNLHDSAGLDKTLTAQHEGAVPSLTEQQLASRHLPSAADVSAVSNFLQASGFTLQGVGPNNLFVKATGTVGRVDSVFDVELHQYSFNNQTFRASAKAPKLPANIAPLVASVGGLNSFRARPFVARPGATHPNIARTSDPEGMVPLTLPFTAGANGLFFSAQCFYPPTSETFQGGGVTATYQGTRYGAPITNTAIGQLPPCGYQPSDLQTAYNMNPLYQAGLDGTGETVAIVDAYGSITIQQDAAVFAAAMGLPPVNLTIVGTPTESGFSGTANSTWADETTLDVEWVHAMAPGAKIVLVVATTDNDDDMFAAEAIASAIPGVVTISNSWGEIELSPDLATVAVADGILRVAGARGQGANFSAGDNGDEAVAYGFADVDWPASSPYGTAVGGVSVALNANKHIIFQSSWGTNITEIADKIVDGSPPIDPPNHEGFLYGGGGGISDLYPLPYFQRGVSSGQQRRMVPDLSWVADPYTGVEIVETLDSQGDQFISVIGGTSVASPLFSGLWAITNQRAGHRLGQAAPYLYSLPPSAITDVVAPSWSPSNVTGSITDANGTQPYTSWYLAAPLQGLPSFVSALYNSPYSTRWFVLSFGLDSTLQTTPGYDLATGLGTPNGWNFVQSFGRGYGH